ncbi:MAG: hypothetical protein ACLSVD_00430 [Eggerthellaceae bacterium]
MGAHPANLVLDEPTSNLTKRPSRRCGATCWTRRRRARPCSWPSIAVVAGRRGRRGGGHGGGAHRAALRRRDVSALPSSEVRDLGLRVRALADERARERRAPGDAREPRRPRAPARRARSYGKREVLHDVDLDLREGEVAALGRQRRGKSTLCRTIVGLHRESAAR